jgi:hypothetical protein
MNETAVIPLDPNPERTKKLRWASRGLVILTGVLWAIYDIIPSINSGRGDTISENFRDWGRRAWVLPLFWGLLSGHLFLNVGQPDTYRVRFLVAAGIMAGLIAVNIFTWYALHHEANVYMRIGLFFGGIGMGLLLWSQNP